MSGLKFKLINLINIVRLKISFLRPSNIKINGKVKITFNSQIHIYNNSSILINGDFTVISSKLIIKDSNLLLESLFLNESIFNIKETQINSKDLSIIKSFVDLKLTEFTSGKKSIIDSGNIYALSSKIIIDDYFLIQKNQYRPNDMFFLSSIIRVGKNNRFEASFICDKGEFYTGDNVFINYGSVIRCLNLINIGSNVFISYDVLLFDNNSHSISPEHRLKEIQQGFPNKTKQTDELRPKTSPVFIGDNCWLGMRCAILKGSKVGNNSIISLGCVVTGNVPDNNLAYGNPFKIKELSL
jgi:acetyltransferase-like isoleucine patch superfamily enzyme